MAGAGGGQRLLGGTDSRPPQRRLGGARFHCPPRPSRAAPGLPCSLSFQRDTRSAVAQCSRGAPGTACAGEPGTSCVGALGAWWGRALSGSFRELPVAPTPQTGARLPGSTGTHPRRPCRRGAGSWAGALKHAPSTQRGRAPSTGQSTQHCTRHLPRRLWLSKTRPRAREGGLRRNRRCPLLDTHARAHAHAHALTPAHAHAHTHAAPAAVHTTCVCTHTQTHMHTHPRTHAHTHTSTRTQACTYTPTCTHPHTRTPTRTHMCTRTHAHTHTYSLPHSTHTRTHTRPPHRLLPTRPPSLGLSRRFRLPRGSGVTDAAGRRGSRGSRGRCGCAAVHARPATRAPALLRPGARLTPGPFPAHSRRVTSVHR